MTQHKQSKLTTLKSILLSALCFAACLMPVAQAGTITYLHNDALGSAVAATNEQGAVLWQEAYRPYGERIRKEAGNTHNVWFTGKPVEATFGLSYFGARWYDPKVGRFMAIDPVGFNEGNIQSFNRYVYANNNPYKYVDPDGRYGELTDAMGDDDSSDDTSYSLQGREVLTETGQKVISGTCVVAKACDVLQGYIDVSTGNFGDAAARIIPTRVKKRKAPEFDRGKISESGFLDSVEKWLGPNYKSLTNGRYLSKDGLRQVRYGKHETNSKRHHGHFEAYDKPGGKVIETSTVDIVP